MPTTQDDLQAALFTAETNINNFEPSPPPPQPPPPIDQIKDAVARNTAQELATALFPLIQQIATEMADQEISTTISAQLTQLQNDVNAIKTQLGIS